jgi:hypothetical protein
MKTDGCPFSSSEEDDDADEKVAERTALLEKGRGAVHAPRRRSPKDLDSSCARAAAAEQLAVLRLFCLPKFRLPMSVVWATAFGGAMHEPAVPFFYLGLGLSAAQIGQAGGILTTGSLLLSPLYGWLFDKKSAELALVIAISLCGGGCLLRALATGPNTVLLAALVMSVDGSFESLVLAYVVRDVGASSSSPASRPPVQKGAVISAFLVQIQLVRIAGRSLYPAWNWLVRVGFGVDEASDDAAAAAAAAELAAGGGGGSGSLRQLLRFRLVLGSCVVPCLVGFFMLLCHYFGSCECGGGSSGGKAATVSVRLKSLAASKQQTNTDTSPATADSLGTSDAAAPRPRAAPTAVVVCVLAYALMAQGASAALLAVLWPLFLHEHFAITDTSFAPLLLVASLSSAAALAAAATVQRRLGGPMRAAALASCGVGLGAPAAFATQCPGSLALHTALFLPTAACVALLEASLKAAASELAPRTWQGSTFGVVASLIGAGSVLASVGGSVLYEHSLGPPLRDDSGGEQLATAVSGEAVAAAAAGVMIDDGHWSTCDSNLPLGELALGLGGLLPFLVVGGASVVAACGLLLFTR